MNTIFPANRFHPGKAAIKWGRKLSGILIALLTIAFLAHTAGVLLRWYICGHAPWANAYESEGTLAFACWKIFIISMILSASFQLLELPADFVFFRH